MSTIEAKKCIIVRFTAEQNQWHSRQDRGIKSRTCIFEFIKSVYGPWLGKGMTQADLKQIDPKAWRALQNRMQKDDMPNDLILPKKSDTYLPDPEKEPEKYALMQEIRSLNRKRMAVTRALDKI